MYKWCSLTIRIYCNVWGYLLVTIKRDKVGGGLHSRAFLARNRDLEQVSNLLCIVEDGLPLQSVHLWDYVVEVVWGVLGTVAQSSNFNCVVLCIQSLSMQVVGDRFLGKVAFAVFALLLVSLLPWSCH